MRVSSGQPAALRAALADRVAALRHEDPLEPITVLVGTSLQRPFLQRWLAARLGAHANVADPDARRPGAAARRGAARRRRGAGRSRRWPTGCCWPTSRASTRGTSRRSPRPRGSARPCSGWCGSCAARGMTSLTSDRCWMGRPTRRRRRARSPGSCPSSSSAGPASTARMMRCWRPTRLASTGWRCSSGGCSTCRRRSSGCCAGSPSGCLSTSISPIFPRPRTRR